MVSLVLMLLLACSSFCLSFPDSQILSMSGSSKRVKLLRLSLL